MSEPSSPLPFILEPATVNDIEGIMEVERTCFQAAWTYEQYAQGMTQTDRHCSVVARWEGRVVGYAAMDRGGLEAHIATLGVLPNFRRQGIGRALLRYLLQWARQHGVETVSLEVRQSNVAAQQLYRQHGFVPVGQRCRYYTDNGEDALIMVREDPLDFSGCPFLNSMLQ